MAVNQYTLYHPDTGHIIASIRTPETHLCDHLNEKVCAKEGGCLELVKTHYVDCREDNTFAERMAITLECNTSVTTPGTTITITKPEDCWLMVNGEPTLESEFVTGNRDFRANAIGKYSGEVHVTVRSEDQIRAEAMKAAMEAWFAQTPEAQALLNCPVCDITDSVKDRFKS